MKKFIFVFTVNSLFYHLDYISCKNISEMCDEEDVVLAGSDLHNDLVKVGDTDIEAERDKGEQLMKK